MDTKQSFAILNLKPNVTLDEARKAYKAAVVKWHPDKFQNQPELSVQAEEHLKSINIAYEQVVKFLSQQEKERNDSSAQRQKVSNSPPGQAKSMQGYLSVLDTAFSSFTRMIRNVFSHQTVHPNSGGSNSDTAKTAKNFKQILKEQLRAKKRFTNPSTSNYNTPRRRTSMHRPATSRPIARPNRKRGVDPVESVRPINRISRIGDD